jgi:hypothetical protein
MNDLLLVLGIMLLVVWLVGLVSSYTLGGFIYVGLAIGIVLMFVSLVTRRRLHR